MLVGPSSIHEFVDFGDDQFTRGRAHPMLDPTLRNQAIVQAGADPHVGMLLLDFVLGLGAHPDPAGAALPAIRQALDAAIVQSDALRRTMLARAFRGGLVPQDTGDEPAVVLLELIAVERAAAEKVTRKRRERISG